MRIRRSRTAGRFARTPRRTAVAALGLALLFAVGLPPASIPVQPAAAQAAAPDHASGQAPSLPTGAGRLSGRVLHGADPAGLAGVRVTLYALAPDGMPGMDATRTDAQGRFAFDGLSNDPGVSYLLGARYGRIPFSERVRFESGQSELQVDLRVADVSEDAGALAVKESTIWLDWIGPDLRVRVSHRIHNAGERVVAVDTDRRAGREPLFEARMPERADRFQEARSGMGARIEREDRELRHWGPFYPGDQEIRYQYWLRPDGGEETLTLRTTFPDGTGKLTILSPASAPAVRVAGLKTGANLGGGPHAYRKLEGAAVTAGDSVDIVVEAPEASSDASTIRMPQVNLWIDFDDTAMLVSVEAKLQVESATHLLARSGEPLVHLELPPGADFVGLSDESERVGALLSDDTSAVDVLGPLAPGEAVIAYRYRLPVRDGVTHTELAFDHPVGELNLLLADTGVVLETQRLHRRRPFVSGERFYLHHQAYQIATGERIEIGLRALRRGARIPPAASTGVALGLGVLAALFLMAPLRGEREEAIRTDAAAQGIETEREAIYAALADLEHDFETGKLEPEEYEHMRGELRAAAVSLLRQQRELASADPVASAETDATGKQPTRSCPQCGASVSGNWRFCSGCGGALPTTGPEAAE